VVRGRHLSSGKKHVDSQYARVLDPLSETELGETAQSQRAIALDPSVHASDFAEPGDDPHVCGGGAVQAETAEAATPGLRRERIP
jgi:hypothetical protein